MTEDARVAEVPSPAPRSPFRRAVRILAVPAAVYIALVVAMSLFEHSLIFFPSVYPDGDWQPRDLNFEDAWFESADGTKLHGWYVPHDAPRAVVLFAHGNGGNLSHRQDLLRALAELRVSTLIFDYQGYGRSSGSASEQNILSDARAARRWLAERSGVSEREIVLMGESLGGGVMVDLAARDGARALVLENTFTSLPDVAAYHYPWLPVRLLMRTRLDSLAKIGEYRGPLLIAHGNADTIIPYELGRRLFDAANEPKRLVTIERGDHNDPRSAEFYSALDQFLDEI